MEPSAAVFLSLFFLALGVITSVLYYLLQGEGEENVDKGQVNAEHLMPREDRDRLRLEYETLNENVQSRGHQTLVAGSIILAASVLIMVEGLNGSLHGWLLFMAVMASLALYGVWLMAYSTTKRIDDICHRRMRQIESRLGIEVHGLLWERIRSRWWYRYGRSIYWQVFFWILLVLGLFIMLRNF